MVSLSSIFIKPTALTTGKDSIPNFVFLSTLAADYSRWMVDNSTQVNTRTNTHSEQTFAYQIEVV